jgi:hypothetical protein
MRTRADSTTIPAHRGDRRADFSFLPRPVRLNTGAKRITLQVATPGVNQYAWGAEHVPAETLKDEAYLASFACSPTTRPPTAAMATASASATSSSRS